MLARFKTYAVDGLVQNDLGLVQLLLDPGDTARLVGVLVVVQVVLHGGEGNAAIRGGRFDRCERDLGEELVHEFGEHAVSRDVGIVLGDDDASDAFGTSIAVDNVV